MAIIPFVAKVSRIKNRKDKEYYVHRVNLPSEVAGQLKLEGGEDYLLIHAQKAEWYHMLNWGDMPSTWARLPDKVKADIAKSLLPHPPLSVEVDSGLWTNSPPALFNPKVYVWVEMMKSVLGEKLSQHLWNYYTATFGVSSVAVSSGTTSASVSTMAASAVSTEPAVPVG